MRKDTLSALNKARKSGRAIIRAVNLETSEERLIDPAAPPDTELEYAAAAAARADKSGLVEFEGYSWFLAVHNPPLDLVIVGAAHIAQPLSKMARLADYQVRIIDPRTAFATPERFPDLLISHDWPDEALSKNALGARSALVALTHDPKIDDPAIIAALESPCFYIGALGSKKTHAARLERLRAQGFKDEHLGMIHGPIGLAISARSPAEIAISILAEITQCLRAEGGKGARAAPHSNRS
jgi:xanthine dehydrogenase accessory factor